ncbi:MAG TPA: PEGA domain-containing protein [Myxococcota bacterium]|jgi:hypothetical protein|nr:PEGA domain-containing protein [Myxococcota bacterium]
MGKPAIRMRAPGAALAALLLAAAPATAAAGAGAPASAAKPGTRPAAGAGAGTGGSAASAPASAPAAPPTAPLATIVGARTAAGPFAFWGVRSLGVPDAEAKEIETALEAAAQRIALAAKFRVMGTAAVAKTLRAPSAAPLAACDGSPECVKDIATLCGAAGGAIAGQVGGLGGTYSANLILVAPSGEVLRRTDGVLERGPRLTFAAEALMARLLLPEAERGLIAVTVDIAGAHVFVDGADVGTWPLGGPLSAPVGKHAVRVTHPAYHDFVQFVDVPYRGIVDIKVTLAAFPVLEGELTGRTGTAAAAAGPSRLPWYRRWWAVTGLGVVLLGASAAIAYAVALPDFDYVVTVRRGP